MARDVGTASLGSSTGAKSINIGRLATDMNIVFRGAGILPSNGYIAGGFQYSFSDPSAIADPKAIKVRNSAGTVILEGTWTSFTGTHVNFNITTLTGTAPQMLLEFGY